MTYSKHLSQSLRCHRHFFHSPLYSFFSFTSEKNNAVFLHCNRNTRPNKIEADDSNCSAIYCISFFGLVSFPLWVQKKKKIDHRFSFFIFLKKKNQNLTQIFFFHFSMFRKKIEHRFSFFTFLCSEKNENLKINCQFLFFIF